MAKDILDNLESCSENKFSFFTNFTRNESYLAILRETKFGLELYSKFKDLNIEKEKITNAEAVVTVIKRTILSEKDLEQELLEILEEDITKLLDGKSVAFGTEVIFPLLTSQRTIPLTLQHFDETTKSFEPIYDTSDDVSFFIDSKGLANKEHQKKLIEAFKIQIPKADPTNGAERVKKILNSQWKMTWSGCPGASTYAGFIDGFCERKNMVHIVEALYKGQRTIFG